MNISPEVIEFHAPLAEPSSRSLTISNTTDIAQAFKIKTTAPKLYCVRPNASFIKAGQSVNVAVIHQGFKEEPAADFKCKDKFMILSCPLDEPHLANLDELIKQESGEAVSSFWSHIEATSKDLISSKKIRAVAHPLNSGNPESSEATLRNAGAAASVDNKSTSSSNSDSTFQSDGVVTAPSTSAGPVSAVSEKELAEARAKIQYLLKEIDNQKHSSGMATKEAVINEKDTKEPFSSTAVKTATKAVAPPTNGIPVSIAALMILVAFLIGWLL